MLTQWLTSILSLLALFTAEPTVDAQPLRIQLPEAGARVGLLEVPRLHLRAPIYAGTSLRELGKGVGHLDSTYWPGMGGTVALFAHRGTPMLGEPHGPFWDLPGLVVGDRATVKTWYGKYSYRVVDKTLITEYDWHHFRPRLNKETLLLAACSDKDGNGWIPGLEGDFDSHRYVVELVRE